LQQPGERAGSGAGTQVFGRDDAPVHAASCGTQQQGLGGRDGLGRTSMAAPGVIEGAVIHVLNDQEAKKKMMPTASNPRLLPFNLINCNLYD
jgi:hypothetical protein